jgi:hypothetical protein
MHGIRGVWEQYQGVLAIFNDLDALHVAFRYETGSLEENTAFPEAEELQIPAGGVVTVEAKIVKPSIQSDRTIEVRPDDPGGNTLWCGIHELRLESDVHPIVPKSNSGTQALKRFTEPTFKVRMQLPYVIAEQGDDLPIKIPRGMQGREDSPQGIRPRVGQDVPRGKGVFPLGVKSRHPVRSWKGGGQLFVEFPLEGVVKDQMWERVRGKVRGRGPG